MGNHLVNHIYSKLARPEHENDAIRKARSGLQICGLVHSLIDHRFPSDIGQS